MSRIIDPSDIRWERYPAIAGDPLSRKWLETQALLGLAQNTVEAYARGVQDFMEYCRRSGVHAQQATRDEVARYVGDLRRRPSPRGCNVVVLDSGVGLSNATMQQRLTAVRLFFDYLIEENIRDHNPVGRGRYTAGKKFGGKRDRGLLPRFKKLPWIPSDEQWMTFLAAAREESIRNRCMIGLAYDAGLRRQEVCLLQSGDLDPAHRTIRIRAETTKGGSERVVPYSPATGELLRAYFSCRRTMSQERGLLFLSESQRNRAVPITFWTWSKVIRKIANRAGLPQFSTHTLRHLCLTDLARAGWDLHEIARFAGHRNLETTQQYIHLSCSDLAHKLAQGMQQIHEWRLRVLSESFLKPEDLS
jgi:site-specific recombinase XerD